MLREEKNTNFYLTKSDKFISFLFTIFGTEDFQCNHKQLINHFLCVAIQVRTQDYLCYRIFSTLTSVSRWIFSKIYWEMSPKIKATLISN
jgi:hypothetical protein